MLDQAKSSATPRRTLAGDVPQPPKADQSPLPEAPPRTTEADEPLYSIRVAENPGTTCAACGKQETGTGPVGFLDDEASCDLCLLERSADLGLILALISVVRAYPGAGGTPEASQDALAELGAFSRSYHHVASKSWPARMFRIPGLTGKDDTTH
ncbi:MAG: hypothetical protein GY719_21330 [bacterium]|nr:hypothetical protein [bacterium]